MLSIARSEAPEWLKVKVGWGICPIELASKSVRDYLPENERFLYHDRWDLPDIHVL